MTSLSIPVKFSRAQQQIGLLLLLITLAGAALRFYKLDYQDFWHDEASTADHILSGRLDVMLAKVFADGQPPLAFFFNLAAGNLLGESEWALRLPSAIAGTLCIPAMYLVARRWFGYREALLGAALLAVLRFPIHYSQEARPYAWLLLFSLLAVYYWLELLAALRAGTPMPRRAAALYFLFGLLAAYTHYFGFLSLLWQGALLLAAAPRRASATIGLMLAFIPGYFLWLSQLVRQFTGGRAHIHIPPPNTGTLKFQYRILFNDAWYRTSDWLPQSVAGVCILLALLWCMRRAIPLLRKRDFAAIFWLPEVTLLIAWGFPIAFTYFFSLTIKPLYVARYMMAVLIPAVLLVTRGVTQSPWRKALPALAIALLAFFTYDLLARVDYYNQPSKAEAEHVMRAVLAAWQAEPETLRLACTSDHIAAYYSRKFAEPQLVQAHACSMTELSGIDSLLGVRPYRQIALAVSVSTVEPALLAEFLERYCLLEHNIYYWSDFYLYETQPCP